MAREFYRLRDSAGTGRIAERRLQRARPHASSPVLGNILAPRRPYEALWNLAVILRLAEQFLDAD